MSHLLQIGLFSLLGALPVMNVARIHGAESALKQSVGEFHGYIFSHATAWVLIDRAVIVLQFPLSAEYHQAPGARLSEAPWRHLAILQPEHLPQSKELALAARRATFLVVAQAPDGVECVINTVQGEEAENKLSFLDQLNRSRVIDCKDVLEQLQRFKCNPDMTTEVIGVLSAPLLWNSGIYGPRTALPSDARHDRTQ